MRSPRRTARRRLDQRLVGLDLGQRPPRGWVRAIREALGMTTAELGQRMGLTQSRVSQIERSEELGSIRLDTLERAAQALNCQVRYVFVPNEPPVCSTLWCRRWPSDSSTSATCGSSPMPRLPDEHPRRSTASAR
jgi:DNA-binding Xre family transcriptional regulator